MRETLRHKELFEIYYQMGKERSLVKLREKLQTDQSQTKNIPTLERLKAWSKAFNWQDRVKERDQKIAKELEKKSIQDITKRKLKYQRQIAKMLEANMKRFDKVVVKDEDGKIITIKIDDKTPKDFESIVRTHQVLIDKDLELSGEGQGQTKVLVIQGAEAKNLVAIMTSKPFKKGENNEKEA